MEFYSRPDFISESYVEWKAGLLSEGDLERTDRADTDPLGRPARNSARPRRHAERKLVDAVAPFRRRGGRNIACGTPQRPWRPTPYDERTKHAADDADGKGQPRRQPRLPAREDHGGRRHRRVGSSPARSSNHAPRIERTMRGRSARCPVRPMAIRGVRNAPMSRLGGAGRPLRFQMPDSSCNVGVAG